MTYLKETGLSLPQEVVRITEWAQGASNLQEVLNSSNVVDQSLEAPAHHSGLPPATAQGCGEQPPLPGTKGGVVRASSRSQLQLG